MNKANALFINYHNNRDRIIVDFLSLDILSLDITYNFIDTLNIINSKKYDIIFCDFSINESKILELLERIKKHHHCKNVPIVLIVENEHNLLIDKILEVLGGYDTISLPISYEKVYSILEKNNIEKYKKS